MDKQYLFFGMIIISLLSSNVMAQTSGCTDPQAINYNAAASINDGSCVYPPTNYNPVFIDSLSSEIQETSGLLFFNGSLWTINDSDNEPILYQIDTATHLIIRRIYIDNASNIDWEALSQSDNDIFIGDIGNDNGSRTDLKILKISKAAILSQDTVSANFIYFSYPEQTDFAPTPNNTSYDCEAFFYAHDSLYLFTKDWVHFTTTIYAIPNVEGTHNALLLDTYSVDGLVTDAAFNDSSKSVVLIGYKQESTIIFNAFICLLFDFPNRDFLSGNKRKLNISSVLLRGQTEGITWTSDYKGYLSGEAISSSTLGIHNPAKLHAFDLQGYFTTSPSGIEININPTLSIYPNPVQNILFIIGENKYGLPFQIVDVEGNSVLKGVLNSNTINVKDLPAGHYSLHLNYTTQFQFVKL